MTLKVEWLLVPDGLVRVFQTLLIYWDFHAQPSLGFTENGPKKRKYPVSGSCESRFLLQHSDGRARIWRKDHESMDTSCFVSTVQAGGGGVMVWGIFSWHTLDPLVPIEHCLK